MKPPILVAVVLSAIALTGCNESPSDKLADRVETAGDKRADVIENNADALRGQAAALDNRAETVRDTAESRAAAIKAADMKLKNMTEEQRDAIVANQAPAVR
jgi:outer membrane murein-binding lipoprotein Lpp